MTLLYEPEMLYNNFHTSDVKYMYVCYMFSHRYVVISTALYVAEIFSTFLELFN